MSTGNSDQWSDVRRRIEAATAAIEGGLTSSPERQRTILKARANALAREPEEAADSQQSIEVVKFAMANETYAMETRFVREVQNLKDLTPVPCTPAFIAGVINVRGQILAVIDIKNLFELPSKGIADVHNVIIVQNDAIDAGVLADVVLGVKTIRLAELQPSLPTLTGVRAEYLKGVTSEGLVILYVEKLLSNERISVHDQVEP